MPGGGRDARSLGDEKTEKKKREQHRKKEKIAAKKTRRKENPAEAGVLIADRHASNKSYQIGL